MTPTGTDESVSPVTTVVEISVHGSVTLTGPGGVVARVQLIGFTRWDGARLGTGAEAIVGVDAPRWVPIVREELYRRPEAVADILERAARAAPVSPAE